MLGQLVSRVHKQGGWDDQQDKGTANAACIGDYNLGVLCQTHDDEYWDRNKKGPHSFDHSSRVLKMF